jgi:protoporphyrinogen/coproporphyrinogen III oxidase
VTWSRPRVAVIGGGLTGLATAWYLRHDADVVVLEASDRLGGQIRTEAFAGTRLDVGADAFLARQPEAERLVRSVGIGDDLVAPLTGRVLLWVDGRLRPLPDGTVLGAPTDLRALARSRVVGPVGLLRAAAEPLVPRRFVPGDRSIADLVGSRFGPQVVTRLVEPLLSGVYAGDVDALSTEATAPPLWAAAGGDRSLRRGLRAYRERVAADDRPVFLTVRGGLDRVVNAMARELDVRSGTPVTAVTATDDGWRVAAGGTHLDVDQVVVCVPAAAAAGLVRGVSADRARELLGVRTVSVAVVALAYDRADAAQVPESSGVLVPRGEGRLVKAVTYASRKWPHHAEHPSFLLRASVGRVDDPHGLDLDDEELAERVDAEVRWMSAIRAPARERRVVRWPTALPQYDVGHLQRTDRIRALLEALPAGLHLGGASLDGVGLSARARDAERLAEAVRSVQPRRAEPVRSGPARPAEGDPPVGTLADQPENDA